jgi:hypothetical protein
VGETGSLAGAIVLENRGALACSLQGTPRLRLVGAANPAGVRHRRVAVTPTFAGVAYPSLHALQPGEKAEVYMVWSNWCGRAPSAVELLLPGLRKTVPLRPAGETARCDQPKLTAFLAAGPLQPIASETPTHIPMPLTAAIVEHVHFGPKTVEGVRARPGTVVSFRVELTNTSNTPFAFARPCPLFLVGVDTLIETYRLNCRPAGVIQPGQTVVFETRAPVPGTAQPGSRLSLTWSLAPLNVNSPSASGAVVVTRS